MRRCELCGYHLDMHSELCERIQKAIARAEKAEAECKRLRGLADIAIVAMQNGDFKKAETHLMPMLIRLEI